MSRRFDTMLTTALRLAVGDSGSRTAAWRQIIDIVAQAGPQLSDAIRAEAFEQLAALRDDVPVADRRMAAASLAGRSCDPLVTLLFARDLPSVAAPFLARAELSGAQWQQLVPVIPAAARNILRNRRDLPDAATDALTYFTAADLTLPPTGVVAHAEESAAPGVTQIRDLVDRIAAYRLRVPMPVAERDTGAPSGSDATESEIFSGGDDNQAHDSRSSGRGFSFETTADGLIDWVEGAPRTAIIGMTIAEAATFGHAGVDGQAAGAWRRRAPVRDARLVIAGRGDAAGDWLISALPLFNPLDGRFCGYRGSARRPRPDEHLGGPSHIGGVAADSLRQLVHELRTPLNAIHGFAEMIDRQLLGPAAFGYRERARTIMAEAERLVTMVDDLDIGARLETGRLAADTSAQGDIRAIARQICVQLRGALAARGVELVSSGLDVSMPAVAALPIIERAMARLLAAVSALAVTGERMTTILDATRADVVFAVSRPAALTGRDESTLLDPGYGPDGDWPDAPLLGLGFTLRLVARLAAQAGGKLTTLPDRFELSLPVAAPQAEVRPA